MSCGSRPCSWLSVRWATRRRSSARSLPSSNHLPAAARASARVVMRALWRQKAPRSTEGGDPVAAAAGEENDQRQTLNESGGDEHERGGAGGEVANDAESHGRQRVRRLRDRNDEGHDPPHVGWREL